ncbi:MAG: sphingosine kinase [Alphaproteobacteria bacterium]|nr:sphingosine kinase [Alphaproteobacteria bacterium]
MNDSIERSRGLSADTTLCLLNGGAHSGAAQDARNRLGDIFNQLGSNVRIELPAGGGEIEAMAREAAQAGAKLVIAGGGDGTINAVANALAGTETALGVLPLGTLNHFAKDLGIPLDLETAASTALRGTVRRVDVGEVNGRVFINNSSIGLYPQMVREREALQEKGRGKWTAFAEALVDTLRRSPAIRVRLWTPERIVSSRTELVFVGNNEYELAMPRVAARLRLDGGMLWIWNVPRAGRFRAAWAAFRALFAAPRSATPFAFCTQELRVSLRRRSVDVAMDGEVLRLRTPLLYRSRPRALRVIVPAEGAG